MGYVEEHYEQLRKLAPECMVILKKDGSFPLQKPCRLALYGNGSRHTIKGGTGSGDVNLKHLITIEEALKSAGFTITTKDWLDGYDAVHQKAKAAFVERMKEEARQQKEIALVYAMGRVMPEPEYDLPLNGDGDAAVYVLSRICGEGSDRQFIKGDFLLTDTEMRDILSLQKKYSRFLLVLNTGGPVDLEPVEEVQNILLLSQLGEVTADAFVDVLLGKAVPSGKLTTTWTRCRDYPSIGSFGESDETEYREGIYVGYRYFDSAHVEPMYPFGYGLSWTSFHYGKSSASLKGTIVTVMTAVENTGSLAGKETVEVYVSCPSGRLDQPYQKLAGYQKSRELAPGETDDVEVSFDLRDCASYDSEIHAWILETGRYVIRCGASSRENEPVCVIELNQTAVVQKTNAVGGTASFKDWKPDPEEAIVDAPVLELRAEDIRQLSWKKASLPSMEARQVAASMTLEDAVKICLGRYSRGIASIIGSASTTVAGAAGETAPLKGYDPLVMADGPAGLRLNMDFCRDAEGAHGIGSTLPAGFDDYLPPRLKKLVSMFGKTPKDAVVEHQYCSAIPIGTALSQSYNPMIAETCGDIVGEEMELFHVDLWLAPATNIHRSVLCGRNFEYFSEDPLVAGTAAAAITRGVQKHKGKGVVIKHFVCNNQEFHRMINDSCLSERALREIYLRPFELCIRNAQPKALMTSYNLLNGVHTSERRDLLVTLLREEWGYQGLIMTDWVVKAGSSQNGKNRCGYPAESLNAGNDLFMPGSESDFRNVMKSLKKGTITQNEIVACAARVIESILHR